MIPLCPKEGAEQDLREKLAKTEFFIRISVKKKEETLKESPTQPIKIIPSAFYSARTTQQFVAALLESC